MNTVTRSDNLIGDVLASHASSHPERDALEFQGRKISYRQLQDYVDQCARAYLAVGLTPGDCVAMLSTPRPEAFISFLAAARLGLLWLGLNPKYQQRELTYVVGDAQPRLLISLELLDRRDYAQDIEAMVTAAPSISATVLIRDHAGEQSSFYAWIGSTASGVDVATLHAAADQVQETAPALLVYTSGSSGKPKGVLLRQRELLTRSRNQNARFPTKTPPVLINPLPINHIGGMHFLSLYAFVGGGCIRFAQKFSAGQFIQALNERSISVMYVLPTMFKMMVDDPGFSPHLLDNIEWFVFSGAAMSTELIEIPRSARCRVGLTYGMTETCGSVTYSDPDATVEQLANTIGRPAPAGEVRVGDENGVACPVGVPGEIQVGAKFCMGGYLNRENATREAYTADGWLRTGDSAVLRADGNIRLIGRRSEMFKSGGYNVYPREVELVLESRASVALAAVVGVPDPLFDEVGWAYVVPASADAFSETDLRDWCRKELAAYKIPKRFIVCAELPLLPVGKVDKVCLRTQAKAQVQLEAVETSGQLYAPAENAPQ
ncbi:Long-chain-fatty-acid--CoA ligase (plasmid) [Cupriavidus necator H850]|uniref:class I adenylate-forming enzyme family protein n=1 Tax=Cupriavidus necator TaxID=106590 RepID=UPI00129D3044|nr:class I adenylate-forming enzyme family protein [Cupriavidus necator]KAI3610276.1 Long-chain-fatty-acid--CoA ligase [Cupriavidus necator H850]